MKYFLLVSVVICILFCRDSESGEKKNVGVDGKAPVSVEKNSPPILLNPADPSIKGIYSFTQSKFLSKKLGVNNISSCVEVNSIEKIIKMKDLESNRILTLQYAINGNNSFALAYLGETILKGFFFNERSYVNAWPRDVLIKFFFPDDELDSTADYVGREDRPYGTKKQASFYVKKIETIEDCEMEREISDCTQSGNSRDRKWPDCKPPGYKNLR
ncbi:hypothetical protein EHO59_12840 [Leptospira semungkisensis]|uniref:Uncharacterized protein n=1 Tax=Leptospira semungkisensis TaxID=2484985 RepID=A0A4R9FQN1_9LEPT|nr:hypothetical protein [Leptospira semungkisensis]TGK00813.1 hypothetical protein EHO59_12840 [Leptospira semungkisensis]